MYFSTERVFPNLHCHIAELYLQLVNKCLVYFQNYFIIELTKQFSQISKYAVIYIYIYIFIINLQWLKITSDEVKDQIQKLGKKGLTPSQIGVILRDSHGVSQVRFVTGNKILRIMKAKGMAPTIPEDLYHLIKKAVSIRKHLERNRKVYDICIDFYTFYFILNLLI